MFKKKILYVCIAVAALLTACDDTTDYIGESLTNQEDLISVSDGLYKIKSRSVVVDSVLSRSILGYLGKVKDPETGTYITSNFMTQFHTFENYEFPDVSMLSKGITADSCQVRLFYNTYYGDPSTPMKATLYELKTPAEENQNYYSSFNPEEKDMIRLAEGAVNVSKVYTLKDGNLTDSVLTSDSYVPNITFNLNNPYTDKDGKKYNNYGTYIMQKYYDHPEYFKNSYSMIHNVCPGFYIKTENGVGSMAYIYISQLNTYFTYKDSVEHQAIANFSGTEEVRQVTQITNDISRIKELADDNTCTYVKSPAGLFTELTIPVEEICNRHEGDSIASAKVVLQCLSSKVDNEYSFSAPATLLMVKADEAKNFFEKNKIADYRTTFVAPYTKSSNTYTFSNIGELVKEMYRNLPADATTREQWKALHPSWNKVLLIPVNATYSTYNSSNVLTKVSHDMSLSSVRLVGGSANPNGDIEISVIYSKFTNKD